MPTAMEEPATDEEQSEEPVKITNKMRREADEKVMKARCLLTSASPFYGQFAQRMNWMSHDMPWKESEKSKTMAVYVNRQGSIDCIYYPPFVQQMSVLELYGIVQHEIEHIVRLHCTRRLRRDPKIWNIACDMCVNGAQSAPRIGWPWSNGKHILPFMEKAASTLIWIPNDWPSNETAEYFYDRLMQNTMVIPQLGNGGETFDDHSRWGENGMTEDELREVIGPIVRDVVNNCRGNVPGHLVDAIKALSKPIVNWRMMLKNFLGNHVGNKRATYSRRNRRQDAFGVKGFSRHAAGSISVVVDTSGSVCEDQLKQFFTEIEAMADRAKISVLQWDHAMQDYNTRYRRGDWKKIQVKGRGGTDMAAPVEWLFERSLIGNACIMLTDGECNYTEKKPFPMITVISGREGSVSEPEWGQVIYLT